MIRSQKLLLALSPAFFTFMALSCRTLPGQAASEASAVRGGRELLPTFPVEEWKSHEKGPKLAPYNVQDQLYDVTLSLPEIPMTKDKIVAVMTIKDASGKILKTTSAKVGVRGFTSFNFPKKQYSVSLLDKNGEDDKLSLLGMTKAEDWVLSAPYNDKSLLRDILTYSAANQLGQHAPNTRIVNLTMAVPGRDPRPMGVYVLTEKNTIGKGRVDIPKKDAEGNTAFQATFDHWHEGDNVVWRGRGSELIMEYPSFDKITEAQTQEFLTVFNDVDTRLSNPSGPQWNSLFEDRLDLATAVDFFLLQEMGRNADGYRLSSGIYLPPKGKIHFGPLWDFNLAYGNATHENGVQWDGWRAKEYGVWFEVLMDHPKFCSAAKTRWIQARKDGRLSNTTLFGIIDANAAIMAPRVDENFKLWGGLGQYLWPNPYYLATWDREVDALKSWLSLRTEWMDKAVAEWNCSKPLEVEVPQEDESVQAAGDPKLGKGPDMTPEEEQKFRVPERADYHLKNEP